MSSNGFKDLKVYQMAYEVSMKIFELSKSFPSEEKFALTDQVRRSSRSVCSNIAEAYRKRIYPKHFSSKITDADGEASETIVWLDYARDCGYSKSEIISELQLSYEEIGKMLGSMAANPEKFTPKYNYQK